MQDYLVTLYRGTYCIQWREGGKQKRRSLGTEDRKEAQRLAAQFAAADEVAAADQHTIEELWNRYRRTLEGRPAWTTMGYEAKTLLPFFGHLTAADVTPALCDEYMQARRIARKPDGTPKLLADGTPRLIAEGTMLTELNRLSNVFAYAVRHKMIAQQPEMSRPGVQPARERHLTRAEFGQLMAALTKPHLRMFCVLALTTGGRQEALLSLTWDRVDLERGLVHLKDPKAASTGKNRAVVPINNSLREALVAEKARSDSPFVVSWLGDRVGSVKKGLAEASKRAKVPAVSAHVFRHTAAVWMAEGRVRMEEISQFLGHADTGVTEKHYARFSPDYLRGAASVLEL